MQNLFVVTNNGPGGFPTPQLFMAFHSSSSGTEMQIVDQNMTDESCAQEDKIPDPFHIMDDANELFVYQKALASISQMIEPLKDRITKRLADLPPQIVNTYSLHSLREIAEKTSNFLSEEKTRWAFSRDRCMQLLHQTPESLDKQEWIDMWIRHKKIWDKVASEGDEDRCAICQENVPNVKTKSCKCNGVLFCASCILGHYYRSTDCLLKSNSTCPTCREPFKLNEIIPEKQFFIKSMNEMYRSGQDAKKKSLCQSCKMRDADTNMTCCEYSQTPRECSECFFGKIYEKKYFTEEPFCEACNKNSGNFMVLKPFSLSP